MFDKHVPGSSIKIKVVIDNVKGWRHVVIGVSSDKEIYFQLRVTKNEGLPSLTPEQEATNNSGKGFEANIYRYANERYLLSKALLKSTCIAFSAGGVILFFPKAAN